MKRFKGTIPNFGTVSVMLLLMVGQAWAEPPASLKPGGYFNPWVITEGKKGNGTIQAEQYTGGSPLTPGNIFNPYVIERNGNELNVRPEFPYPTHNRGGLNHDETDD